MTPCRLRAPTSAACLPEIAKPAFAMQVDEVAGPIQSGLGWHVVQLKKIVPAGKPSFDEAKDRLREDMKRDQAIDTATREVNQLDDDLAAGHALEDIADGMKLRLIKIPALDTGGKTPDGKDPPELPYKNDVLKAAFAQQSGETSPVMDDHSGNYFVVRTDGTTPSAVKPFDQVKDQVAEAWTREEQGKRAAAEAEKIAKPICARANPLRPSRDRPGVEVRTSKPLSLLGDNDPSLPQAMTQRLMQLKKGETTLGSLSDRQLVLRLATVTDLDDKELAAARDRVAGDLNEHMPKDRADQYLRHLRVLYPVDIRKDALEAVSRQGG